MPVLFIDGEKDAIIDAVQSANRPALQYSDKK